MREVDVAIIGSGSAGLYALGKVRASGKSFVLINGGHTGTTCARVGCMPSKALIQVAEDFHRRHILGRYGAEGHKAIEMDIEESLEHVRDLRDTFVDRVDGSSTDKMGDDLFIRGYARFLDPHTLEVEGQRIHAGKIVIATGSTPIIPKAWEAFGDRILTTDSLFELEDLPETLAVIGLGVIGLEIGQALARLEVKVTGFDALETIGGLDDPVVAKSAIETLSREFPIHLGHAAEISAEGDKLRVTAGDQSMLVDKVLASLGRRPNLEQLQLENAGIELDDRGIPLFDRETMQLGDSHIFIAGDADGERPLLHEAGDEGRIAGHNATADRVRRFRRRTPLAITFCDPNICHVGARFDQIDPETSVTGEINLGPVGRAMIMGRNRGVIRIYAARSSGLLLGAELFCTQGEHLAHELAWAIAQGMTVGDTLRLPFYHPVLEEAMQAALYDLYGKVETKNPGPIAELQQLD